jgi:surface carbohydrate biosynthesis protein (TIGR04326 family)
VARRAFLIDSENSPLLSDADLVFALGRWEFEGLQVSSLPRIVDEHAESIQQEIVNWIGKLKSSLCGNLQQAKSNIPHEFSELNPCFEGNYATTPEYFLLAQLMALTTELSERGVTELTYIGTHPLIAACISDWCMRNGVLFHCDLQLHRDFSGIRNYLSRWHKLVRIFLLGMRNRFVATPLPEKSPLILWDYLVANPVRTYWGSLVSNLPVPKRTLCIHQFTAHDATPTIWKAFRQIRRIRNQEPTVFHIMPEEVIRPLDAWRTYRLAHHLRTINHRFTEQVEPSLDRIRGLRPGLLLNQKFTNGWCGGAGTESGLQLILFDRLSVVASSATKLLYLLENHNWEKVLLYCFRGKVHRAIGVAHTVVRPLDLRYQIIADEFKGRNFVHALLPNVIATNGSLSYQALESLEHLGILREVEALRYQSLTSFNRATEPTTRHVLLVGDLQSSHTLFVLQTVIEAVRALNHQVVFKPHPADRGSTSLAETYGLPITNSPLINALENAALVIAGSITAASVETAQLRIPVLTVVDPRFFNLSPLRNVAGFATVYSPRGVSTAIEQLLRTSVSDSRDFFYFDSSLKRWRSLLVE